jgi:hypothetical protein
MIILKMWGKMKTPSEISQPLPATTTSISNIFVAISVSFLDPD